MPDHSSQEKSFPHDLYPGVDGGLREAYSRNTGVPIAAAEVSPEQQPFVSQPEVSPLSPEEAEWIIREVAQAAEIWKGLAQYTYVWQGLAARIDTSGINSLHISNPNFVATASRLFAARQTLLQSGEMTPNGELVGDTMAIVLIPWGEFSKNLADLQPLIECVRTAQGIERPDRMSFLLGVAISENEPIYKSWDTPDELYTPSQYLDRKLKQDGAWGMALMQTSSRSGANRFRGLSPDMLSSAHIRSPELAELPVGSMGFLEWLALTMQVSPNSFSSEDFSLLMANRIKGPNSYWVPVANCDERVYMQLYNTTSSSYELHHPRLTVM